MKIAFAGLATSHPYSDAGNLRELRPDVRFAILEPDAVRRDRFLSEHPTATVAESLGDLMDTEPDGLVVTVPPPQMTESVAAGLDAGVPVFANKPAAVTNEQVDALDAVVRGRERLFLTSSVLRFAPSVADFRPDRSGLSSLRVTVRHDVGWWLESASSWQDAPDVGGGLVSAMGVHAFDLLAAVVAPDFQVRSVIGAKRHYSGLLGHDVDLVTVDWPDGLFATIEILGCSEAEEYRVVAHAPAGDSLLDLATATQDPFGFRGTMAAFVGMVDGGSSPVPWPESRSVLRAVADARLMAHGGEMAD